MASPRRRWALLFVLIAVLTVMALPSVFFRHPAINDAIFLADAECPLLLVVIGGAVAAYFVFQGRQGAIVRTGLGVFLVGAAVSLLAGLFVFGNLSDDRFAPLLLFRRSSAWSALLG